MKTMTDLRNLASYTKAERGSFESDLKKLVDIPSVSSDPERAGDVRRCAQAAVGLLESIGGSAEIVETKGHPVVFGEIVSGSHCPTVLVYNHLDVQPADASEWKTQPFNMTIAGDKYLGRGTTDDKGPALAVLYAARYAKEQGIPINIKFLWEMEEEIGSPSLLGFLQQNSSRLSTDSVVVSDTIWVSRDRPAIGYGLRGLQGMVVKLSTGAKDVHSGVTGGLARNPIGELAKLISQCYDATTGNVTIPGFYDDVRPLSQDELSNFVNSGFTVSGFKKDHELKSLRSSDDADGVSRVWARPTFEVHGIVGGYSGPSIKTIVPHKAEAKLSMRLVPDQEPMKIFKLVSEYMRSLNPDIEIEPAGSLSPYLGDFSGPYALAARQSMSEAFGRDPAFVREGGSIGAVLSMKETLAVPVVFLGLSLPEHGYHAINENFDWAQAEGGINMFVRYFQALTAMNP